MPEGKAPLEKEKINPRRMAVLRSLPLEIKQRITGEEARAFLYDEELPDSLIEKLGPYLEGVEEDEDQESQD